MNAKTFRFAWMAACCMTACALPLAACATDQYEPPPGSGETLGPSAPGLSFVDQQLRVKVSVLEDRRSIRAIDPRGGLFWGYEPLHNAGAGAEGQIVAVRPADLSELAAYPERTSDHVLVATFSSGHVLVMDIRSGVVYRPKECQKHELVPDSQNVACRYDLDKAEEVFEEAFLMPSPPLPADTKPLSYTIPHADITIRVEADRRHVSAWDATGHKTWTEDPFDVAGLRPYRYVRPVIVAVGSLPAWAVKACDAQREPFAAISYNSSQFGCLNARTGRFLFLGQN